MAPRWVFATGGRDNSQSHIQTEPIWLSGALGQLMRAEFAPPPYSVPQYESPRIIVIAFALIPG